MAICNLWRFCIKVSEENIFKCLNILKKIFFKQQIIEKSHIFFATQDASLHPLSSILIIFENLTVNLHVKNRNTYKCNFI